MKGFTLIEILVVIAILVLLSALVWPPFMDFKRNESLRAAVLEVESVLHQARSQTLASQEGLSYGVWFDNDRLVLFRGEEYNEVDDRNVIFILPPVVSIDNIELSGDSTMVVFDRLTGEALFFGQIDLVLTSNTNKRKVIEISPAGVIMVK